MITAVTLLKVELKKYEDALDKSREFYSQKKIKKTTHIKHIKNLKPLIQNYKDAIEILEQNMQ